MKIVHFSDPHGGGPAEDFMAYFDKRWVGVFNYSFRRKFRHDLSRLCRAVEYIMDTKPDLAVCTGDLTSAGQPGEFEKVLNIIKPLWQSDIPLIYTPGNHDCYVKRTKCVEAVKNAVRIMAQGKYSFDTMPLKLNFSGVDLLIINTSAPSNLLCSWGFLGEKNREFIKSACEKNPDIPKILISHYPMTEDHPWLRVRHRLFGQGEILDLMESKKLDLVLCGHVHRPYLKVDQSGRGECCAGSVSSNGSMVEISCDQKSHKFDFKNIALD
ncbi:MAG: metallophosphoesterase [Lentisphaeria bacterium]|nr:metallophosphoesterase [Lentisphaeria bacterium]